MTTTALVPTRKETNPALAYLATLSHGTSQATMRGVLNKVASMAGYADLSVMPWKEMRYEHVLAIRTKLEAEGLSYTTINKILVAVRQVVRQAWIMEQVEAEDYHRVKLVRNLKGTRLPKGRMISYDELYLLIKACHDKTPAGTRDAAIINTLAAGGLRRAELASLSMDNLQDDGSVIALRVVGKGNKERIVYLDDNAATTLRNWLTERGDAPGPLFWAGRRGGHLARGKGMSPQAIRDMVHRRALQAALAEKISPHDFRRSFISTLLNDIDLVTVAALVGHSSVNTTQKYDRRPELAKRKAAKLIKVPL